MTKMDRKLPQATAYKERRESLEAAVVAYKERCQSLEANAQRQQEPVAWLDIRTAELGWEKRIVATNPQYVENNGPENFAALYAFTSTAREPTHSALVERAKECALYDFDSIEMVECNWALWQDIINALSVTSTDSSPSETYTEICMNEKCPRGQGVPIEVVRPLPRPERTEVEFREQSEAHHIPLPRPDSGGTDAT